MAHFAELDENNIVLRVIVVSDEDAVDGEVFCNNLLGGSWKQTSYNTRGGVHYTPNTQTPDGGVALRKNFSGIGFTYDLGRDAFIPPKPYDSWILDETTCKWEPPVPYPNDGTIYEWNEETQAWDISDQNIN